MFEFLNNLMVGVFIVGDVLMVTLSIRLVLEIISEIKGIKKELGEGRIIND